MILWKNKPALTTLTFIADKYQSDSYAAEIVLYHQNTACKKAQLQHSKPHATIAEIFAGITIFTAKKKYFAAKVVRWCTIFSMKMRYAIITA